MIECDSHGETLWTFPGGKLKNNAVLIGGHKQKILLAPARKRNSGIYRCLGFYPDYVNTFVAESFVLIFGEEFFI